MKAAPLLHIPIVISRDEIEVIRNRYDLTFPSRNIGVMTFLGTKPDEGNPHLLLRLYWDLKDMAEVWGILVDGHDKGFWTSGGRRCIRLLSDDPRWMNFLIEVSAASCPHGITPGTFVPGDKRVRNPRRFMFAEARRFIRSMTR